jgi:hypothetical protein
MWLSAIKGGMLYIKGEKSRLAKQVIFPMSESLSSDKGGDTNRVKTTVVYQA